MLAIYNLEFSNTRSYSSGSRKKRICTNRQKSKNQLRGTNRKYLNLQVFRNAIWSFVKTFKHAGVLSTYPHNWLTGKHLKVERCCLVLVLALVLSQEETIKISDKVN